MPNLISHLLLVLAVVMIAGRLMGRLLARVDQPPVIGEVIGGIVLGPSLLGVVWPEGYRFLMPAELRPLLRVVAEIGVVSYMFLIGLEMNPAALRGQLRSTVTIAASGMVAPFVLGLGLAVYLYPLVSPSSVPFSNFALFFGISLAVTAFPVLARILSDLRINRSPLGIRALACAAMADVSAWIMLAVAIGIVHATPERFAIVAAFLAGAVIPHDSRFAVTLHRRVEPFVVIVLLPAFFAFTGMNTQIGLVGDGAGWAITALIIVIATAGKFGGTSLAARATGATWRHAAELGVLMNTRGLMEIVVLNIGLEIGVISPTLFTMLVIMAIVTTMATSPILKKLLKLHM
jgi:Kef-type K+ transport system membrane component KefB